MSREKDSDSKIYLNDEEWDRLIEIMEEPVTLTYSINVSPRDFIDLYHALGVASQIPTSPRLDMIYSDLKSKYRLSYDQAWEAFFDEESK